MPPEIEAAVSPLWQRTGQPVTLTAVVTETDPLYRGDVWAEVAGPDPATRHLAPGTPWQTTFTGGQEGPYTAAQRACPERSRRVATGEEKGFILDSTPPDLALTLASAPPFGYIVTSSVYYGEGSGVFILTEPALPALARAYRQGRCGAGTLARVAEPPVPRRQVQAGRAGERSRRVNNASAWVEAGPVVVSVVTKYYLRANAISGIITELFDNGGFLPCAKRCS